MLTDLRQGEGRKVRGRESSSYLCRWNAAHHTSLGHKGGRNRNRVETWSETDWHLPCFPKCLHYPSIWITPRIQITDWPQNSTLNFFCRVFTFTAAPWQLYLRSGRFDRTKSFPRRIWEFLPLTHDSFPKSESASEKEPGNLPLAASQKILPQKAHCRILLDTEHSHEDCAMLCSSFAQLPPKPNRSAWLRYSHPHSKVLPLLPYLHLLLCTGS